MAPIDVLIYENESLYISLNPFKMCIPLLILDTNYVPFILYTLCPLPSVVSRLKFTHAQGRHKPG